MFLSVRSSSLTAKAKSFSSLEYDFFLSFIIAAMPAIPFLGIPCIAFPSIGLPICGICLPFVVGCPPIFSGFFPIPFGIFPGCPIGGIPPCLACIGLPFDIAFAISGGILPIPLAIPIPIGIPFPPLFFLLIEPIRIIILIISDGALRSSYILWARLMSSGDRCPTLQTKASDTSAELFMSD